MPAHILGLVTIKNPGFFLPNYLDLPQREATRSARANKLAALEGTGLLRPEEMGGSTRRVSGSRIRQFDGLSLKGSAISRIMAEPRIIYLSDERTDKPNRKIEIRAQWPDEEGQLNEDCVNELRARLSQLDVRISTLWINPSLDSTHQHKEWANLMLRPFMGEVEARRARLRFPKDRDSAYICWNQGTVGWLKFRYRIWRRRHGVTRAQVD